jgi:hypothetical protein
MMQEIPMSASNRLRHWDPPKARRSALRSANGALPIP